jgi:hypothetical protein
MLNVLFEMSNTPDTSHKALFEETLPNFIKRKHPSKNGREKESKNKDQSPGREKSPKELSHTFIKNPSKHFICTQSANKSVLEALRHTNSNY